MKITKQKTFFASYWNTQTQKFFGEKKLHDIDNYWL